MTRTALRLCAGLLLAATALFAAEVQIYTEEGPPLNYTDQGTVTGSATEIVKAMAGRAGLQARIESVPWARGYKEVQERPGVGLYSTTRNAKREELFHWIGPVARKRAVLWGRKGSPAIADLEAAKKVRAIGIYRDDAKGMKLKELGFTNLDEAAKDDVNPQKLIAGRIDLWICGDKEGPMSAKAAGVDPAAIEIKVTVSQNELYLVFVKATDPAQVKPWQDAYAALVADGTIAGIVKRWDATW